MGIGCIGNADAKEIEYRARANYTFDVIPHTVYILKSPLNNVIFAETTEEYYHSLYTRDYRRISTELACNVEGDQSIQISCDSHNLSIVLNFQIPIQEKNIGNNQIWTETDTLVIFVCLIVIGVIIYYARYYR